MGHKYTPEQILTKVLNLTHAGALQWVAEDEEYWRMDTDSYVLEVYWRDIKTDEKQWVATLGTIDQGVFLPEKDYHATDYPAVTELANWLVNRGPEYLDHPDLFYEELLGITVPNETRKGNAGSPKRVQRLLEKQRN